jgi:molybdate transport system ATP-binding protein
MSLHVLLRHRFPSIRMDVEFEVQTPGVTVLFGPSGAGKSTIINAASGLLRPDECRILIDGQILGDTASGTWLPPEKRQLGLVFQDSRLFPHMSVLTNLHFGMRRAGNGPIRFDEVVELLGIGMLLTRRPHTLSGGERQRVAIGRALLAQPRLLLMDEPLASLDAARKSEIMPYLTRLKTVLELPILYVTHAFDEVAQLADSIVLLNAGQLVASGPLPEITARGDLPLAQRDDAGALLLCRVMEHDAARELTRLEGGGATLWVPLLDTPLGAELRIRIPAREVILAGKPPEAISVHNVVPGKVRRITSDRARRSVLVEIALASGGLISRVTPDAIVRLTLAPGRPVLALIKSTSIEVLGIYPPMDFRPSSITRVASAAQRRDDAQPTSGNVGYRGGLGASENGAENGQGISCRG